MKNSADTSAFSELGELYDLWKLNIARDFIYILHVHVLLLY